MEKILVITSDGVFHHFNKVESYTYDRDFIRVHHTDNERKQIAIFPTMNVQSLEITKGGENND